MITTMFAASFDWFISVYDRPKLKFWELFIIKFLYSLVNLRIQSNFIVYVQKLEYFQTKYPSLIHNECFHTKKTRLQVAQTVQ